MSKEKKRENIYFVCAMAFFCFWMLFHLTHSALWGDEWVEYEYSQKSILNGDLYQAVISTFQPPLYNFLMHFWLMISTSLIWFRLFNVFCGIIAGFFLYCTVKELTSAKVAAGSIILLSGMYQWVYCAQECSEYMLMLMFLSIALFCFVKLHSEDTVKLRWGLILACVGAMYCQYGAFFVVVPLLLIYYCKVLKSKEKRKIIHVTCSYVTAGIVFAFPLYMFFARMQMANNQISESSIVRINMDFFIQFPRMLGNLMRYFYNIGDITAMRYLLVILGITLAVSGIILLLKKQCNKACKNLILTLLISYCSYYLLVYFHIYAMVHPEVSAGYYSRYAYFFMPLLVVTVPTVFFHLYTNSPKNKITACMKWAVVLIMSMAMLLGLPDLIKNWHKSCDDEIAELWIENSGYEQVTYMVGCAEYGLRYYAESEGCMLDEQKLIKYSEIDYQDMPDSFWIWRTNWGEEGYQSLIRYAQEHGYQINSYVDQGYAGQLVYCSR